MRVRGVHEVYLGVLCVVYRVNCVGESVLLVRVGHVSRDSIFAMGVLCR